jgi:hypothetical protein
MCGGWGRCERPVAQAGMKMHVVYMAQRVRTQIERVNMFMPRYHEPRMPGISVAVAT